MQLNLINYYFMTVFTFEYSQFLVTLPVVKRGMVTAVCFKLLRFELRLGRYATQK